MEAIKVVSRSYILPLGIGIFLPCGSSVRHREKADQRTQFAGLCLESLHGVEKVSMVLSGLWEQRTITQDDW